MFSAEQKEAFDSDGYVRLPAAVPAEDVGEMYERIWAELEQRGAARDDPSTWCARRATHLQEVRKGDPAPGDSPAVRAALDAVFGEERWQPLPSWGQVLVTFPSGEPWTVPNAIWHLDHPYVSPDATLTGATLFLFVDDVVPRGGGTLVLHSSPRLIARFVATVPNAASQKMKTLRRQFDQSHPWLRELTGPIEESEDRIARFMGSDSDLDGIPARVVELTGKAGDVVLSHPWAVHAGAPNSSSKPRMMRVQRVHRR